MCISSNKNSNQLLYFSENSGKIFDFELMKTSNLFIVQFSGLTMELRTHMPSLLPLIFWEVLNKLINTKQ